MSGDPISFVGKHGGGGERDDQAGDGGHRLLLHLVKGHGQALSPGKKA